MPYGACTHVCVQVVHAAPLDFEGFSVPMQLLLLSSRVQLRILSGAVGAAPAAPAALQRLCPAAK